MDRATLCALGATPVKLRACRGAAAFEYALDPTFLLVLLGTTVMGLFVTHSMFVCTQVTGAGRPQLPRSILRVMCRRFGTALDVGMLPVKNAGELPLPCVTRLILVRGCGDTASVFSAFEQRVVTIPVIP